MALGTRGFVPKYFQPIQWLQSRTVLSTSPNELDEGCSEPRSNLAINSHGLATGNYCKECKFGMLSRPERHEFGSVPHLGGVYLGAVHEWNEIRSKAGE